MPKGSSGTSTSTRSASSRRPTRSSRPSIASPEDGAESAPPPLELSRYCVPWTPFAKAVSAAKICLVTTAGVYHPADRPFAPEGDNGFRAIPGDARASDLRYSDEHYPHDCVDADLNCVFPIDRLRELAGEGVIAGLASSHFSMGFTQQLAEIRRTTIPRLARAVDKARPDAVLLTAGWRLCHRTVVSVQRAIEMIGIPTVVITVEPEESRQARPPRALSPLFQGAVEPGFSVGRTMGRPNDPALHRAILRDALQILASPGEPGRIEVREYE